MMGRRELTHALNAVQGGLAVMQRGRCRLINIQKEDCSLNFNCQDYFTHNIKLGPELILRLNAI